ncbi:MAG: carboxypeptidase-like regulatory domain-containing protein, partial [Bacteroidota bacterium]
MKTRIVLALFVSFIYGSAIGQFLVKGKVIDEISKEPLSYCAVVEEGTANGVYTDFEGDFVLKLTKLPATLQFKALGFNEFRLLVTEITNDPIQVELDDVSQGPIIEIRDSRITEKQKQNPLTVERLDLTAIKNAASGNFYESLGTLKGVDLTTASLGFRVINTRGFNSTSPVRSLQLIDGVDNQSPGLNFSLGNFLGAPDLDVVGVDIVQGASSAFFGPGAFNGVVKMETKNPFDFP